LLKVARCCDLCKIAANIVQAEHTVMCSNAQLVPVAVLNWYSAGELPLTMMRDMPNPRGSMAPSQKAYLQVPSKAWRVGYRYNSITDDA
jgi:hypothetical protein